MGLSSSQVRLLTFINRNADITRDLQHCSNQKQALTREMDKVSYKYRQALSQKVLKWSNNSGVDYVDLNYTTLMSPGKTNNNKPVLITNNSGRVMINKKYQEYAEKISQNGNSGGNYSGETRIEILSALTGISKDTLSNAVSAATSSDEALKALDDAQVALERFCATSRKECNPTRYTKLMGIDDKAEVTSSNIESFLNTAKNNMKAYLSANDLNIFSSKCDELKNNFSSSNEEKITGEQLKERIYGYVKNAGTSCNSKGELYAYIKGSEGCADEYEKKLAAVNTAKTAYENAINKEKQVMTSPQEREVVFYDQLFTAIAECGWCYDEQINDNDYLNQMFQNNEFYITTMEDNPKTEEYDCDGKKLDTDEYLYKTDLWSDTNNIFAVNDENIRQEALAEYEYEKRIINEKETRIDTRMKNLETEQSAIQAMMEGLKAVENDNIDSTFKIFA